MPKYKHKINSFVPKYFIPIDYCPKCKEKFRKKKFSVVWHDVLECHTCGNIWVALDYKEALKWLNAT